MFLGPTGLVGAAIGASGSGGMLWKLLGPSAHAAVRGAAPARGLATARACCAAQPALVDDPLQARLVARVRARGPAGEGGRWQPAPVALLTSPNYDAGERSGAVQATSAPFAACRAPSNAPCTFASAGPRGKRRRRGGSGLAPPSTPRGAAPRGRAARAVPAARARGPCARLRSAPAAARPPPPPLDRPSAPPRLPPPHAGSAR